MPAIALVFDGSNKSRTVLQMRSGRTYSVFPTIRFNWLARYRKIGCGPSANSVLSRCGRTPNTLRIGGPCKAYRSSCSHFCFLSFRS